MIPSYVSCTSGPFRILVLTADQIYRLKVDFYQPRPRSRTTSSSRGRPRPRSRTSRPLQTRSTQKQRITNYRFVKLDYHAEPNHPAKYDGPGIHSLKVRFYRHNGMSLIFKAACVSAASLGWRCWITTGTRYRYTGIAELYRGTYSTSGTNLTWICSPRVTLHTRRG